MTKKTSIIPNKSLYFPTRRIEQRETDNSRTVVSYSEKANIDIKQMHKTKDIVMIQTFIDLLQEGPKRDLFVAIYTADTRNVLSIDNKSKSIVDFLANKYSITARAVNKAIKYFVDRELIYKLNKFEYMANPYVVIRNDLGTKKIEQLQMFWDEIVAGVKHKSPIVWEQALDYDEDLKQNLTEISKNISKRQEDMARIKHQRKLNIAEDIETVENNIELFHLLLDKFLEYNSDKYTLTTIDKQHFRNWLVKQSDCPPMYNISIKPLNIILTSYNVQKP